jgi:hypothetical protein
MLAVPPDRPPDAIIVPRPFRGMHDPGPLFNREFGPILGPKVRRLFVRPNHVERNYYITADPNDTIHFPKFHPLEGVPRYDWFVVADSDTSPPGIPKPTPSYNEHPLAVRFGWLQDEATLTPLSAGQKAAFEGSYLEALKIMAPKWNRLRELMAKTEFLTPDEQKELKALQEENL